MWKIKIDYNKIFIQRYNKDKDKNELIKVLIDNEKML